MNTSKLICLSTALFLVPLTGQTRPNDDIPEVSIRHISSAATNQGVCSIRFGLGITPGGGDGGDVSLNLSFIDKKGKVLYRGSLETTLTDTRAGRYQEVFMEEQAICFPPSTRVEVTRATAKMGPRSIDLLKAHKIRVDDFQPYRITTSKRS